MEGHEIRKVMCDDARAAFRAAGLTYNDLTLPRMQLLQKILDRHLRESLLIKESFRANKAVVLKFMPNGIYGAVTCRSSYFKSREAVAFNPDGFIGFAGWSDHVNIVPILSGFKEWMDQVVVSKEEANPTVSLVLPWRREPLKVHILPR
jgi:hypothetical protein